jgi:hypothetical protein
VLELDEQPATRATTTEKTAVTFFMLYLPRSPRRRRVDVQA